MPTIYLTDKQLQIVRQGLSALIDYDVISNPCQLLTETINTISHQTDMLQSDKIFNCIIHFLTLPREKENKKFDFISAFDIQDAKEKMKVKYPEAWSIEVHSMS